MKLSTGTMDGLRSSYKPGMSAEELTQKADAPLWAAHWFLHRKQMAEEIRELLEVDYPEADKVVLVCDNLNTHKMGSLYQAFEPAQARRLAGRLEVHYTPKHGSWLNIAESELSVFTRQCLDRRIPEVAVLRAEARHWYRERNATQKGVDWQFTTDDARIKLHRLYPQIRMS